MGSKTGDGDRWGKDSPGMVGETGNRRWRLKSTLPGKGRSVAERETETRERSLGQLVDRWGGDHPSIMKQTGR